MKKIVFSLVLALAIIAPAMADWRIDIGFDIPRGLGGLAEGEAVISEEAGDFFDQYIFPFPEAGVYYQKEFGALRVGGGLRVFTFILESVYWPNAFVELDLGKVVFAFQLGGGLFGMFGLYNDLQTGQVLIPDLSAWFKIGSAFRLGGGALGVMLPELGDAVVFAYYLGAKFAIEL